MKKKINIRWQLVLYDIFILLAVDILLLAFSGDILSTTGVVIQGTIGFVTVFVSGTVKSYAQKCL